MNNKCNSIKNINTFSSMDTGRCYFLDTNVLYWYSYPRFGNSISIPKNATPYYNFVDTLVASGNPLYTSIYNLTELINVIEKNEYDLYQKLHPEIPLSKKDYRRILKERTELKNILLTSLSNVESICRIIDFNFTNTYVHDFVNNLSEHRCDIFDYAILNNCISSSMLNIISDDSDFSSIEKINLYTANEKILVS